MDSEALSEPKRRVVHCLKQSGPTTAGVIASMLGLTAAAVRQHLQRLEIQDLVKPRTQPPKGRGRPSIHWSLTPAAYSLFPDGHAELTVGLIEAVRQAFGEEGLERLIRIRAREQCREYRRRLPVAQPLAERLRCLAVRRTAEGYMAEVVADGPDAFLLIEHHCPICEAVRHCADLCAAELRVFREGLGGDVEVERVRHLLQGGDRCAFRIRPRLPAGGEAGEKPQ